MAVLFVAFAYRCFLVTMNTYPPGADIGLHESVIKSITSGTTDFLQNYYHMGGGLSVTNPGYHIFVAYVIAFTGLPDYLAQALIAAFFSTFMVFTAFLIVKQVWSDKAGLVVAVLVAFSASDISMLSWAGYPNVITLALMPVVFYLLLHQLKTPSKSHLIVTSVLIGTLLLTHVFSAIIFITIVIFSLLVSSLFAKTRITKRQATYWLVTIAFGVLLVLPYLATVFPVYFSSQGTITGTVSVTSQVIVQTRVTSLVTIGLALIPSIAFFLIARFGKRQSSFPSILFAVWILVPAIATHCYLVGIYFDYTRFAYFLALPVLTFVGLMVAYSWDGLWHIVKTLSERLKLKAKAKSSIINSQILARKALATILMILTLLTPLFALPNSGIIQANYFQVMNPQEYEAIEWLKINTPAGSVCVADAELGWWLSGFAQRPTLSAVDPQFLILKHEVGPAEIATRLLAADYLIDNGLIQIQQLGVRSADNTHKILAEAASKNPTIFSINDSQISVLYREGESASKLDLSEFLKTSTSVSSNLEDASFLVTRENPLVQIEEEITVFRGISFARVSFLLESTTNNVSFDWLQLPFQSRGFPVQTANSIAVIDNLTHELSQMIFPEGLVGSNIILQQNPDFYALFFKLGGSSKAEISFFVGLSQFKPMSGVNQAPEILMESNSKNYLQKVTDLPLNSFDYRAAIKQWNISYVVMRDFDQLPRFINDSVFQLVFKNNQVAVLKVARP